MDNSTKYTPTPWYIGTMPGWGNLCILRRPAADYSSRGVIGDAPIVQLIEKAPSWENSYPVQANAEFIVRACNAHEQLVAALRDLEVSANSLQYCFDRRPENFGVALTQLKADAERARAALAAVEA